MEKEAHHKEVLCKFFLYRWRQTRKPILHKGTLNLHRSYNSYSACIDRYWTKGCLKSKHSSISGSIPVVLLSRFSRIIWFINLLKYEHFSRNGRIRSLSKSIFLFFCWGRLSLDYTHTSFINVPLESLENDEPIPPLSNMSGPQQNEWDLLVRKNINTSSVICNKASLPSTSNTSIHTKTPSLKVTSLTSFPLRGIGRL